MPRQVVTFRPYGSTNRVEFNFARRDEARREESLAIDTDIDFNTVGRANGTKETRARIISNVQFLARVSRISISVSVGRVKSVCFPVEAFHSEDVDLETTGLRTNSCLIPSRRYVISPKWLAKLFRTIVRTCALII